MTSKEMPDFDSMSPEELKVAAMALKEERVNFERERNVFESMRKETNTEVRVFVGNIDPKTNEDILRSYFVKFGPLKSVAVLRTSDGTSKRSGIVTFYYTSQAKLACDEMNNKYKDSNETLPLQVKFANVRAPNSAQKISSHTLQPPRPMPPAGMHQPVPPQQYPPYGMSQQQPMPQQSLYPGYMPPVPGGAYPMPGQAYQMPPVMAPGMQQQGLYSGPVRRATHHNANSNSGGDNGYISLYINQLGSHVSQDSLRQAFSAHGNVVGVKIIKDHGYGFVQYADINTATQAMHAMNGSKELSNGTSPLQVSIKTAKKKSGATPSTPAYPPAPKRFTPY